MGDPCANENSSKPTCDPIDGNKKSNAQCDKTSSSGKDIARTGGFAALFGFLLLGSAPAQAGIGSILNSLVSKFAAMFKPLIEAVMTAFSTVMNLFSNKALGGMTTAFSKGFDTKLQFDKEIQDNKIGAATEPPPQMCASDSNAAGIVKTENNSKELAGNLASRKGDVYESMRAYGNNGAFKAVGLSMVNKYSSKEKYQELFDTPLTSGENITSAKGRVLATDMVDMTVYSAVDSVDMPVNTDTPSDKKKYLKAMSKVGRIEVARSVLTQSLSERVVVPGDTHSNNSLLENEINRTYGGSEWRGELASYADSTPLIAELNKQVALSNKINLMQLNKTDQLAQLSALQLIELVGQSNG